MKPRILWMSDSPTFMTGFATQSKELCKRFLGAGFDVLFLGHNYQGQELKSFVMADGEVIDYPLLPGGRQAYGADVLFDYFKKYRPDAFGVLLDSFMLAQSGFINQQLPAKSFFWYPSDGGWFPQGCDAVVRKFDYPVAMARFGQQQLEATYGIKSHFIPHGVMTGLYKPMTDEQKRENRAFYSRVYGCDLTDKFIIGTVARNQGRKMPDRPIKAFARFARDNEDAVLIQHMDAVDPAAVCDLRVIAERFGVAHKVFFSPEMRFYDAWPTSRMNSLYNLFDVHLLLTSGEGFGIPIIEAMAAGVPNVVTNYTTTKELVVDTDSGFAVDLVGENEDPNPSEKWLEGTITGSWNVERGLAGLNDAAAKLQLLKNDAALRKRFSLNARRAAVELFDWDAAVFPQWLKLVRGAL